MAECLPHTYKAWVKTPAVKRGNFLKVTRRDGSVKCPLHISMWIHGSQSKHDDIRVGVQGHLVQWTQVHWPTIRADFEFSGLVREPDSKTTTNTNLWSIYTHEACMSVPCTHTHQQRTLPHTDRQRWWSIREIFKIACAKCSYPHWKWKGKTEYQN